MQSYRREWFLVVSYGTVLAFYWQRDVLLADLGNSAKLALVFLWLFAAGRDPRCAWSVMRIGWRTGSASPMARCF